MQNYKNYILMDNFRGFSKAVVPLCETNFLVGENSSGKSSMLALVKVMTDYMFWIRQEFKSDEVNLGHFADIVSVSSEDKSYFRVGYLRNDNGELNKHNNHENEEYLFTNSFLITFIDKNGVPEPRRLTALVDDKVIDVKFESNTVGYRVESNPYKTIGSLSDANFALNYLIECHENSKGYSRVKTQYAKLRSITYVFYEIMESLTDKKMPRYFMRLNPNIDPVWLAPIRSKPKRTYDDPTYDFSPEGDHTPYLIQSIIGNRKGKAAKELLEKMGKNTGLFKEITLKKWGRNKNSPFELDIVLEDKPLSILNVGYGVSQSMPILAELINRPKNSWFIIQQPEVHLHPKAQAAIGDVIFDSVYNWKHTCLIETHSDYMIDRYRSRVSAQSEEESIKTSVESQILFFSRKEGFNSVCNIPINKDGQISDEQPKEYRDFFITEQMKILGL